VRHPPRSESRLLEEVRYGNLESVITTFTDVYSTPTNADSVGAQDSTNVARAAASGLGQFLKGVRSSLPLGPPPSVSAVVAGQQSSTGTPAIISITCFPDRAVVIHDDLSVAVHRLGAFGSVQKLCPLRVLSAASLNLSVRARPRDRSLIGTGIGEGMKIGGETVLCAKHGKLILSGNYFDGSLRAQNVDNPKIEDAVIAHDGRILCLAVSEREELVVSGGSDCMVLTWQIGGAKDIRDEVMDLFGAPDLGTPKSKPMPSEGFLGTENRGLLKVVRRLAGHVAPVTSVAISSGMAVVVSGSEQGHVLLHNSSDGTLVRSLLNSPWGGPISALRVARLTGNVMIHSASIGKTSCFTLNGLPISSVDQEPDECALGAIEVAQIEVAHINGFGEEVLLTGDQRGYLRVRSTHALEEPGVLFQLAQEPVMVRALALSTDGGGILVGTESGQLCVVQIDASNTSK